KRKHDLLDSSLPGSPAPEIDGGTGAALTQTTHFLPTPSIHAIKRTLAFSPLACSFTSSSVSSSIMHPVDPVRSREQFDREPGSGANAVADVIPTTETSQQIQKERVPPVSQSQGDVQKPGPDADDQDSKALPSQLSSSDATTSLVAVDTAPKQSGPGRPGRPKKKKRGPKPKEVPGSTAAPQDTQSGSGGDTSDTRTGTATYETQKARGQGHPPRGGNVAEQQEACPTRRRQPNRRIQTDEKKSSIRDTAKDPSRSEGKQSSDVSNPRSYYSSRYSSTRLAADEEDRKEEADRNAVEDMDVNLAASQLESVDLSEQDHKKSVSFCKLQHTSSATNQPMSRLSRLFGQEQQPVQVVQQVDLPLKPTDVLANDCGCIFRGPVVGGKAHGEGTLKWTNGEVYKGDFKDGYRTGKGKVTTSCGIVFEGHFHEGVYGKWTFRGQYMVEYVGHFHEGHLSEGKVTYSDGNSYEGTFHEGWRVEGKLTYADGRVYEGRFRGPYSTSLHHSSSVVGLLTFTSDDPRANWHLNRLNVYAPTSVAYCLAFYKSSHAPRSLRGHCRTGWDMTVAHYIDVALDLATQAVVKDKTHRYEAVTA
ncbi:hypothetical protein THAOC_27692, partial [Thalassiosira oceanica]